MANITIGTPGSVATPPAGEATLFINTDDNNILYIKFPDGTSSPYSSANLEECCSCEIAKKITDDVMCAFKNGVITAEQFGVIMGTGFTINSVSGVDADGMKVCTVNIGTKSVAVTDVDIDQSSPQAINIAAGCAGTLQLTATITPSTAGNKKLRWLSSNTAVATVDINTGLVTGVSNGTAIITVVTDDGGLTDTITVNVSTGAPCV